MLPKQLIDELNGREGFDTEAFLAVHASGRQVTSVRLNPGKPAVYDAQWVLENVPWCPHGRYLSERPSFTLDPLLHAGAYYVQEASSMFLWHVLQQLAPETAGKKVLDLCAAPGGKSTLLASFFNDGFLVANEVIKQRVSILAENITKWGSDRVIVTNNDPAHFQSLAGYFDVMVIDAPCSGSGLFRKDPAAVEEWSEANVALCSQRQQRILADALPALKEDGLLIYSTCSYSPQEDEDINDWLTGEMDMENCRIPCPPEWNIVETTSPETGAYGYRFYPHLLKGEGFYIAAFRKKKAPGNLRWKQAAITMAPKPAVQQVQSIFPLPDGYSIFQSGDLLRTIPAEWMEDLRILAGNLYLRKAGIAIGSIKGRDVVPAHELAVGMLPLPNVPVTELDKTDALQYLRKKEINPGAQKGWNLVTYCGLPLGWLKVLPNRANNYYPAEWRILKD